MNSFLKDLIQAPVIGLIFWWSLEPSRNISQDYRILQAMGELAGSIGIGLVKTSWLTIPVLLSSLAKFVFRRSETFAKHRT